MKRSVLGLAAAALAGAVLYYPTLRWLCERYTAPDSYYSHGFLIPAVFAYIVWLKRGRLQAEPRDWSAAGGLLAAAAVGMHVAAMLAGVYFLSGVSLLLFAAGASLFLAGMRFTREIRFPLLFLLFMIPLPLVAVNAISFPMRLLATKASVALLQVTGMQVSSEGFRILMPNDSLVVGSPCSGLRSLITMLALGSLFAYFGGGGPARRLLLVAAAVPVALVTNILRIVLLSSGAYLYGSGAIEGAFHDTTGYLMFVLAFAALWGVKRAIDAGSPARKGA